MDIRKSIYGYQKFDTLGTKFQNYYKYTETNLFPDYQKKSISNIKM